MDTERSLASGESFAETTNDPYGASQDNDQFTGQEYDTESGTDHFQFRQYQPTQGRWMSPDPYDGSYDYANPQSFNRYAYVLNNPFTLTDPKGLEPFTISVLAWCGGASGACAGAASNPITAIAAGAVFVGAVLADLFTGGFWAHPAFHGSLKPRPTVRSNAGEAYLNDSGQYEMPVGIQVQYPTIPGQFSYSGTLGDFIKASSTAGLYVSTADMALPFHQGYQFRGKSHICSPHITDVVQDGSGKSAEVLGNVHYDLLNPLPEYPPNAVTTLAKGLIHGTIDLLADKAIAKLGFPGTIGDQVCFYGVPLIP